MILIQLCHKVINKVFFKTISFKKYKSKIFGGEKMSIL